MKLIIGGAYQGKLAYARETFGAEVGWVDGRVCEAAEIYSCRGISHFHEYIRNHLAIPDDPVDMERMAGEFVDRILSENPGILIVSNELGYGVVPVDHSDRMYREMVGRICTCAAGKADEVVRVVCGIGMRLK